MNTTNRIIRTAAIALAAAIGMGVASFPAFHQDKPPAAAPATPPAAPEQPVPQMPPAPGEHHKWLEQLVGEWTVESEMTAAPGADAIKGAGSEAVKSIGGRWIVTELKMDIEGMGSMAAVQALGYDSAKGKYQGTWIDSIQDYLWVYTGTLDETGKILTLEAEGPSMTGEGTTRYRDVITIESELHRTLTSSAFVNGEWVHFGTSIYTKMK